MLKAEYLDYLKIYINISCICKDNTFNISTNTEGKSLIMKLGVDYQCLMKTY